ncbi:MAG: ATP-binding protein, partial [Rhizobiaceae bacterium]|nr:ATP-binding protein [Rhizobiaceae bacterium]
MQSGIDGDRAGGRPLPQTLVAADGVAASVNAEKIFDRVKTQLKAKIGADVYSSWFGRMKLAEVSKGVVRLSVPTAFLRSWINGHYLDTIADLWRAEQSDLLRVEIVVRTAARNSRAEAEPVAPVKKPLRAAQTALAAGTVPTLKPEHSPLMRPAPADAEQRQSVLGSPLDPRYTFASFVEGPSNRIAFAAARAVAEQASSAVRFNPLFIHASVGLGKTHLLQAVAAQALVANPNSRVVYLTAEYFMWRFATAIRDNNALTLKEQLRDIDLLIIDDMQFLQGKSIQNEFCHLLNMLLDSARQVVVAADRPPAELESLEPRVRSRLNGGVALEMAAPDLGMRLDILKRRLAE